VFHAGATFFTGDSQHSRVVRVRADDRIQRHYQQRRQNAVERVGLHHDNRFGLAPGYEPKPPLEPQHVTSISH